MAKRQKVAISYVRFSTLEQQKGDSYRRQMDSSLLWCERSNYRLDDTLKLADLGVSGFKGHNAKTGKLKKFMDLLEAGEINADALIIESLDRLSRDEVGDALTLFLNILSFGLEIITLKPENIFTKKSINEPVNLILAILEICRGFSESDIKSERVADAWKQKKKNARDGHKVSARCPGWLTLNKATQTFFLVPEKIVAVKRLLELANSGMGINSITKLLNQEDLPTLMDHAKHWHASSVLKTLKNRALFGEYQPRFSNKRMSQKHRQPDGEAIPNYYPALISEEEFHALQGGLQARRQIAGFGQGRQSNKVSFLFPKLLKDALTGSTIYRQDKGSRSVPCLISAGMRAGIQERRTFPYSEFESHFIAWLKEVSLEDLSTKKQNSAARKQLATVRGKIVDVAKKLANLKAKLLEVDESDTLLDVVRELDQQQKALKQQEQSLLIEISKHDPVSGTCSLLSLMETAQAEDLLQLRSKLRLLISELIEVIYIRVIREGNLRSLFAQIHFRNGLVRRLNVLTFVTYSGGGATNPIPQTVSTSVSTPQRSKADFTDLRDPNWTTSKPLRVLAGLPYTRL